MQYQSQQNFFVFRITPQKEKPVPKGHIFKGTLMQI